MFTIVLCGIFADAAPASARESNGAQDTASLHILVDPALGDVKPELSSSTGNNVVGPVGSIDAALHLARTLRGNRGGNLEVVIELGPGTYRLTKPIVLGPEDSGTPERPLVIRGKGDGSSRFVGSVQLERTDIGTVGATAERLNSAARSHVRAFRYPNADKPSASIDLPRFHPILASPVPFEVFDTNGALWPARWPNNGWARIATANDGDAPVFTVSTGRVANWQGEPDLWAGGYFQHDWSYETQRIANVDTSSGELQLEKALPYGIRAESRAYIYHAASELDEEGEWYRDRKTNVILIWPRSDAEVFVPEISYADVAFVFNGASNVRLESVSVERFRAYGIRVIGGSNIVVTGARIAWIGGIGASFQDSVASGIRKSLIADTGEGGVQLFGGNRTMLSPARMFAEQCQILRFSRLGHTFKPAAELRGVGNIVSGNFISGSAHTAIMFMGNEHVVELNEITNVVTDTTDAGAIYTGRDWASRGTVIRHNFIHDIRPARGFETKGVYLDDYASGLKVEGNLFLRVDQPVFIGGGRDNEIVRNLFVASEPAIHIDGRGLTWPNQNFGNPTNVLRTRLSQVPFYTSATWRARYPTLVNIIKDDPAAPKRNISRENLMLAGLPYRILPEVDPKLQQIGPEADVDAKEQARFTPLDAAAFRAATDVAGGLRQLMEGTGISALPFDAMDRDATRAGPAAR